MTEFDKNVFNDFIKDQSYVGRTSSSRKFINSVSSLNISMM